MKLNVRMHAMGRSNAHTQRMRRKPTFIKPELATEKATPPTQTYQLRKWLSSCYNIDIAQFDMCADTYEFKGRPHF